MLSDYMAGVKAAGLHQTPYSSLCASRSSLNAMRTHFLNPRKPKIQVTFRFNEKEHWHYQTTHKVAAK